MNIRTDPVSGITEFRTSVHQYRHCLMDKLFLKIQTILFYWSRMIFWRNKVVLEDERNNLVITLHHCYVASLFLPLHFMQIQTLNSFRSPCNCKLKYQKWIHVQDIGQNCDKVEMAKEVKKSHVIVLRIGVVVAYGISSAFPQKVTHTIIFHKFWQVIFDAAKSNINHELAWNHVHDKWFQCYPWGDHSAES